MQLEGHSAIVVGGGSGLGEATARHFSELGADVCILDINGEAAANVAAEIGGYSQQCDVCEAESVAAGVTASMARFGQAPRIAVNCAGIALGARIIDREGDVSIDQFRRVMDVNVMGTYHIMSYVAQALMNVPLLDNGERGVIINTASVAYEDGQVGQSAFSASKGAVASMCLPAAREFAPLGIRVMTIAPGLFQTPMMDTLPLETIEGITQAIPFPKRLGEAVEYAHLASEIVRNPYLNGTVIRLDAAVRLPTR